MKVGDLNSPSTGFHRTPAAPAPGRAQPGETPEAKAASAFRLDLHPTGAALPESGADAAQLARKTRDLIAESNRDAAGSHSLDVRKLLDLLA